MLPRGLLVNGYTFQRLSALVVLRSCESIGISFCLLLIPSISWASDGFLLSFKFTKVSSCDRADLILQLVEKVWLHQVNLRRNLIASTFHGEIIGIVVLIVTEVLAVLVLSELLVFIFLAVIVHGFMNVRQHFILVNDSLLWERLKTLFEHRALVAQVFGVLFHMDQSIHDFGTHVNFVTCWGLLWWLSWCFRYYGVIWLGRNLLIFDINLRLSTWREWFILDISGSTLSRQGSSHYFGWLIHWWRSLSYFTCTKEDRWAKGLIMIMRKVAWRRMMNRKPWSMSRSK